jgi:acetyl esterase/lipase
MPRVAALGLICPFVDLTVSNSIGLKNELSDYMLSSATLKLMGFMACGRDKKQLNDPYFNAFFGSWDNLPHLTIAVSDSEILYGDSLSIHEIANNKKIPSTLMARSQMGHIWMIFDGYVPEATEANDKFIADMLRCCTE